MNLIRGWVCLLLCSSFSLAPLEAETVSPAKAEYVPGVALSQGITEITGVAISPLLRGEFDRSMAVLEDAGGGAGGRIILLENGIAVFRCRRWCVLDERNIPLPEGPRHVEKGLFSPSLVQWTGGGNQTKVVLFLPHYPRHEESMASHLKLHGVREHPVARGIAAVKGWVGEM